MPKPLKASLAFVNIAADQPDQARDFLQELFGIELAPSLSDDKTWHAPVSDDGIDLNVGARHSPQETTTMYVAVDDLDEAISMAKKHGGEILWGPEELTIPDQDFQEYRKALKEVERQEAKTPQLAKAAIVQAGGSPVGLVELADHAQKHYNAGRHKKPLSDHRAKVHERSLQGAKARGRR